MRNRFLVLFLVLSLLLSSTALVAAQDAGPVEPLSPAPSAEDGQFTDETPHAWFVELHSAPVADGGSLAATQADKANFRNEAKKVKLQFTERFAFDTLWNGLSVTVPASEVSKLTRLSTVKNVYPVVRVSLPPTAPTADPDLFTAIQMTGADIAQSELGLTGKGVKVAIMDTGIDIDHPDFGGNGADDSTTFPTARVVAGWDFVGDKFNADPASPGYNPVPLGDENPDDCGGHGSHVAGIVGANGAVKGVAPDVTFGAYRVFGCEGSTESDIMIAAMERALADDMDILNMSIGSAFQWSQYPTAQAADRLVQKGMVVVASIGNSGANGLWSAGAPGLGKKVIGVAAYDNSHVLLPYFTVNGTNMGYVTMTFSPNPPTAGEEEVVWLGRGCVDSDTVAGGNQTDPYLGDPNGKVALVQRGACSFGEKASRAFAAGSTAVVVQNNASGVFNGTLGAPLSYNKPVVGISLEDGEVLKKLAAPVIVTWTDQQASFKSPTGGLISSFSSYGLAPDLTLKPDLGAPGGNIYSTYPLEKGGYAVLGGTSMSSPHVAGGVALLLQARPNTNPNAVLTLLQNSADPKNWWNNPGLGLLDVVSRQGAGMLDIDDAILATTKIEPSEIATGESQAGPFTQVLTIENSGATDVTYNLSSVNAISTANTYTPGAFSGNASVTFSAPAVTVPAGGTATVTATINPATGPAKGQYGGYIRFTPTDGGQRYSVPFAGFVGDYQSLQVLTSGGYGMPWLSKVIDGSLTKQAGGATYTLTNGDIPYFLAHLDHQSRLFRIELFDAKTNNSWHRVAQEQYLPRNSTSTGFFGWTFDGTTTAGNKIYTVPDGTYITKISVLKALGDENNPADWETWASPAFTIDRP